MHRIDSENANANNSFRNANSTVDGTVVDAAWLNAVQEEIATVIESNGITLTKGAWNQLYDAILVIAAANTDHNSLSGLQGGTTGQYYHITQNQESTLPVSFGNAAAVNTNYFASNTHTHAASDVTSGTFADARISESSVTQHQGALVLTEAQISDLAHYTTSDFNTDFATKSISDLVDVNVISVANSHTLLWNVAANRWENILGVTREYVHNKIINNKLRVYDTSNTELTYGDL